jgi:hypothetical protein
VLESNSLHPKAQAAVVVVVLYRPYNTHDTEGSACAWSCCLADLLASLGGVPLAARDHQRPQQRGIPVKNSKLQLGFSSRATFYGQHQSICSPMTTSRLSGAAAPRSKTNRDAQQGTLLTGGGGQGRAR